MAAFTVGLGCAHVLTIMRQQLFVKALQQGLVSLLVSTAVPHSSAIANIPCYENQPVTVRYCLNVNPETFIIYVQNTLLFFYH